MPPACPICKLELKRGKLQTGQASNAILSGNAPIIITCAHNSLGVARQIARAADVSRTNGRRLGSVRFAVSYQCEFQMMPYKSIPSSRRIRYASPLSASDVSGSASSAVLAHTPLNSSHFRSVSYWQHLREAVTGATSADTMKESMSQPNRGADDVWSSFFSFSGDLRKRSKALPNNEPLSFSFFSNAVRLCAPLQQHHELPCVRCRCL
eukprot:scaffold2405_cov211-Pinguiococcus_pyrenoidosus.AAC.7